MEGKLLVRNLGEVSYRNLGEVSAEVFVAKKMNCRSSETCEVSGGSSGGMCEVSGSSCTAVATIFYAVPTEQLHMCVYSST